MTIGVVVVVIVLASVIASMVLVNYFGGFSTVHASGSKTWQQHYDGASAAGTIVLTADGGFAIVGTSADGNVMVIRTNGTGDVEWRKTYGAGSGSAIIVADDGGFAVAATKNGAEGNAGWLIRTDSEGNLLWSKTYESNGFYGVVNASDGGYVMLGSVNLGGVEYASLLKVDSAGNLLWTKNYSNSQAPVNELYTLIATSDGGYAAAGKIQYLINNVTMLNGWFLKTDADGEIQVNRPFSMDSRTIFHSVAQTSDNGFFLVGETANSTSTPYSACIIRTDSDGHSQWSQINQTLSPLNKGSGFMLYSIGKAASGNYFIGGYLGGVGITVEEIKDNGQSLYEGSFGFSSQALAETISGYVIGVKTIQGGYAWVGFSGGSIWLVETYWYTS